MPGIIIPYLLWQAAGLGVMYTSWSFFRSKERAEKSRRRLAAQREEDRIKSEKVVPHYKGECCECKYLARAEGHSGSYCTYQGKFVSRHEDECGDYVLRRRSGAMRSSHSWNWDAHFLRSPEIQVYDHPVYMPKPKPHEVKTQVIFSGDNPYWEHDTRWGMAYENCKDDPKKLKALDIIFSDDRIHYT